MSLKEKQNRNLKKIFGVICSVEIKTRTARRKDMTKKSEENKAELLDLLLYLALVAGFNFL